MATVVKIVELMGVSESSFEDAVKQAVKEASQTIRNITGVEVVKFTAQVEGDEIFEYHVTVRLAFVIDHGESAGDEGDEAPEEAEDEEEVDGEEDDEEVEAVEDEEEVEEEEVEEEEEEVKPKKKRAR